VAALSMLQDDPDQAPYGWTHCLTMPQATLDIAHRTDDPRRAIAVAATYVLGFRATQSSSAIDPAWTPPSPADGDPESLLAGGPDRAAALVWHARSERTRLLHELASYAACHHDAHLVKYTLACLDAVAADPEGASLFLAAAAYLAAWWTARPHLEESALADR
jgi:hypothetical protein